MLSFVEDRLYEILRLLTCTCPGSSPPLKLQLPLGQILEPFGVSADIVNEYDAFFATDVRVILKKAATAADDVELCQTFPESVNAEPSDDFLRITCGDRPDFLTDLIMPACTAAPEHRLDHAFRDILRVKAAELSPDFTHANGHAVLFCGNALFDWLPVHDAHDIHGSVANIDEHIFAGHITGMKHGSVPLRENEDLPDMDPVVLSPEIKFGIDVLHEIFAEFIFLPGDPGKRKTCRQDYICIAESPHIEFFRDGCQRQDEKIIRICLLALVSHVVLTDHIILIPVSDKVPADDRFLIGSVHTGEMEGYESTLERIVYPALGNMKLSQINILPIQKLYDDLVAEGKAPASLRQWHKEQMMLSLHLQGLWKGYTGKEFDKNFIFIQMETGMPMDVGTPTHKFKEILKMYNETHGSENQLPEITLHELRHTSATLLLANGTDIETVSHRLGHSKASTTLDIYGHAMKKMDSKASDTLESILSNRKKA